MEITKRRALTDLYARGEVITLGEGDDAVEVWVRKMTPADAEKAYLRANARRSSVQAMGKEDEPSELYKMLVDQIEAFDKDALIEWVTATEILKKTPYVEAELAGNEEWGKDSYLFSLQERSMDPEFLETEADLPEDPEVIRVRSELDRFNAELVEAIAEAEAEIVAELTLDSEEELRHKLLEITLESQGTAAWLNEFNLCQIWLCVFWADNHMEKAFPTRKDVDEVQVEVIQTLREALERVHVGDQEGKD